MAEQASADAADIAGQGAGVPTAGSRNDERGGREERGEGAAA